MSANILQVDKFYLASLENLKVKPRIDELRI